MIRLQSTASLAVCALAACLAGCSSMGSSSMTNANAQSAPVFLTGSDAPLPSVVSFQVTVNSVALSNGGNSGVDLLTGPQTIDFARFDGLQTLLDFNSVPAGTYNTVTVSLSNPVISYLNMTAGSSTPPTIATVPNAALTNSTVTVQLPSAFTVTAGAAVGLKMDLDLRQSLLTGANGQLTGQVNPSIRFTALTPNTPSAQIDDFYATVISVDAAANTFMIAGPHGRQYTVALNQANTGSGMTPTEWDDQGDEAGNSQGGENGQINLGNLVANQTIVDLSGQFQPNTQTFDATDVAIVSQHGFYAGGALTYASPASGAASAFQFYVRSLLPTGAGLQAGQIANVNLTGNEKYYVFRHHSPLLQFLFNSSLLTPGQHISIGGPESGAQNPSSVTTSRVVLHLSGITGTIVAGSVNQSGDSFLLNPDGVAGYLLSDANPSGNPIRVFVTNETEFRDGFTELSDLASVGSSVVRIVGLVLKNPVTGHPILIGRYVDNMASAN